MGQENSHMDSESGAKTMIYNTKRNSKRGSRKNDKKEREVEERQQ